MNLSNWKNTKGRICNERKVYCLIKKYNFYDKYNFIIKITVTFN